MILMVKTFYPIFDPLGQATVPAGRDHNFSNLAKENNIRYWRNCGSGRVDH